MLHGRFFRLWVFTMLFLVGSLIAASVGNIVRAAGIKSIAQDNIIISEFRPLVTNNASNDFVEIFNPNPSSAIAIGGWIIRSINNTGRMTTIYAIPAGQQLIPGQHFLIAGVPSINGITSDGTFSGGNIPADGGVAITLADETTIVDMVGMNSLAAEGTPLGLLTSQNQSYERKPGGSSGSCYDSNNNVFDFAVLDTPDPQNSSSLTPLTVCAAPTGIPDITPSAMETFTATPLPSPTSPPTVTVTVTPSAPTHVIISEFRTRGLNGSDDEFVELYNPTGAAVNIGGWVIKRSVSCGTVIYNLFSITSGTILLAGQHFLAATTTSGISSRDQTFSPGLADNGGLALINAADAVVDQVGMCASSLYGEGTSLQPLSGNVDQSYERRPGGSTSCYDLDNNIADFTLNLQPNPQNLASPIAMCAGVSIFTPTRTPTWTPTRTSTPTTTTLPGSVVINEFLPHPHTDWNGDGTANTGDEYIELINMGTTPISLKNWKLDNGVGGPSLPFKLPDVTLLPRQIVHFYHTDSGIGLSDGGGTVRLLKPDGRTADIFNYPLVEAKDQTWCRQPDGRGGWAFACFPTPGRPNVSLAIGMPGSVSKSETGNFQTEQICLAETTSKAIQWAECYGPGMKIWDDPPFGKFFLEAGRKWPIFVE